MAHVSLRVTDQEKQWMESYAAAHGLKLSDAIKQAFFEKLEDEYDLAIVQQYEKQKTNGQLNYYAFDDVKRDLDFDDDDV